MTKKEYLDSLSGRLGTMPYNDVKEIIADIDAHFEDGIAAGKSEADIAKALGDPRDLAIAYMDGNEKIISNALRKAAAEPAGKKVADNRDNNASGPLFVVLFNILVGIPVWFVILLVLLILVTLDAGLVSAIVSLAMKIPESGLYMPGLIFLDIAMFFGMIFMTCFLWFPIKFFCIGTGRYVGWNRKVWSEGF